MITIPTTLILGAGASKPYGFPIGSELRMALQNPQALRELVTECGYSEWDVDTFCETFKQSQMFSIDAFLARRSKDQVPARNSTTFGEIGKAAIALCLIRSENPDNLFQDRENHWYRYLWNVIGTSLEDFAKNQLRIVTFNYDRSLEYFLLTALRNSFGISAGEAASHLSKLPILHVYGQLGELPELTKLESSIHAYSNEITADRIRSAALGIRVIDESRDDDEIFEQAFQFMQESNRICFLGFGFDETNIKRLRINELIKSLNGTPKSTEFRAFATTIGMQDAEMDWVASMLKLSSRISGDSQIFDKQNSDLYHYRHLEAELYLRATGALQG